MIENGVRERLDGMDGTALHKAPDYTFHKTKLQENRYTGEDRPR